MAAARGKRKRPHFHDPLLEILFKRGLDHEKGYIQSLESAGRRILDLADVKDPDAAVAQTLDAMRTGADVLVQAALRGDRWYGRPDVMLRVDAPSALGGWSYQVADTKLARETRAGTILQLGLYSELLGVAQGRLPEQFYVVTPEPEVPIQTYRVDDYAAYSPVDLRPNAGDGCAGRLRCRCGELPRASRSLRRVPLVKRMQQEATPGRSLVTCRRHFKAPETRT